MSRIPKRLSGPAQLANAAATVYTVPANRRAIVRHIRLVNPPGAGQETVTISIGADAAGTRIADALPLADGEHKDIFCYHVLEAAQVIQAFASTAATVVMTMNGDEVALA